ncbi:hypothetical protein FRC09_018724 [Ceratobasidium sp. 395]|nr:hypothetical protein FRC09_018724 [Ceratobasidium sp. 395]
MEVDPNHNTPPPSPFWAAATSPTLLDSPSLASTPMPTSALAPTTSTIALPDTSPTGTPPPTNPLAAPVAWNHGLTTGTVMKELAARMIYALLGTETLVLHAGILGRASEVLAGMFLVCTDDGEGSCPENPWILEESASIGQWRSFIRFLYPTHDKFDAPIAFKRAKEALSSPTLALTEEGDMSPFRRLYLGRLYAIEEWISQAIPQIVQINPYDVSDDDLQLIGYAGARLLYRLHLRMKDHRQQLAVNLPDLLFGSGHHSHCENNVQCSDNWRISCDQITRGLFRKDDALTEYNILALLQHPDYETASMTKMNRLCVQKISRIASRSLLGRDEGFIKDVVDKISHTS